MTTTVHLGFQTHSRLATHIQSAYTLGAIHLVARHGQQVYLHLFHINGDLARALGGVNMKQDTCITRHFANAGDVIHRTDFVVGVHDTDEDGVVAQRIRHGLGCNQTVTRRIQVGDFKPFALQLATGVQHRLMLNF